METELNQEGLKASQISVTFLWTGSEKQLTYNQVPYRNDLLEHLFQRHPAAQPARLAQKGHRKPAVAGIGLGAEPVTEIFGTLLFLFQKGLFIRTKRWASFYPLFSGNCCTELPLQYLGGTLGLESAGIFKQVVKRCAYYLFLIIPFTII